MFAELPTLMKVAKGSRGFTILALLLPLMSLPIPALMWWDGDGIQCTGFNDHVVSLLMWAGFAVAALAHPVALVQMLRPRRIPWLALPVALLGIVVIALGVRQYLSADVCGEVVVGPLGRSEGDTDLAQFMGDFAVCGGLGLLGLAWSAFRTRKVPATEPTTSLVSDITGPERPL